GGCGKYQPGLYTNKIVVTGKTAIFKPGLYYMRVTTPDNVNCGSPSACSTKPTGQCRAALSVNSNGVVRPATPYSSGIVFYLSGTAGNYASTFFGSNAGSHGGGKIHKFSNSNSVGTG